MRRVISSALALLLSGCPSRSQPRDSGLDVTHDAAQDVTHSSDLSADRGVAADVPPPDRFVESCSELVVEGAASQAGTPVAGWPVLYGTARGGDLVVRAPAVARPTVLTIGGLRVGVRPRSAPSFDIPGLAADCGPFAHGVASGDPTPTEVTLWTRVVVPGAEEVALRWVIASDPALSRVVAQGTVSARAEADGTVQVTASGLTPATTYFYAFTAPDGARSALGRTRTAAVGSLGHARFVVASCSSLFSGYFNAYRRIAERDDVDLVVHLGDYIYDFVDAQERVRVPPSGEVEDLTDLASHRRRHALYLSDPDLRAARAAHPWFMLWDNHDLSRDRPAYGGGVQAFREWSPVRTPEGSAPEQIYRALRFGDLVDLYAVDMYLFQGRDRLPSDAGASVLGASQYGWLSESLIASRARWRLVGMQKVFVDFAAFSGWQEHPAARSRLISLFRERGINDTVFLSGDSHFTIYADVVDDPLNATRPYDPDAGVGAVGAEFLPTSITRGNFDESIGLSAETVLPGVRAGFIRRNPHIIDVELASHGYGIVDVRPERAVAETWFSPIREVSDRETFYGAYAVPRGANRFARTRIDAPTR